MRRQSSEGSGGGGGCRGKGEVKKQVRELGAQFVMLTMLRLLNWHTGSRGFTGPLPFSCKVGQSKQAPAKIHACHQLAPSNTCMFINDPFLSGVGPHISHCVCGMLME